MKRSSPEWNAEDVSFGVSRDVRLLILRIRFRKRTDEKTAIKYGLTIPVLNLAFIPPEEARQLFCPDLYRLTYILWCFRKKIQQEDDHVRIEHPDESIDIVKAVLQVSSDQLARIVQIREETEGDMSMKKVWEQCFDVFMEKARIEGEKRGEEKGARIAIISIIEGCAKKNHWSEKEACECINITYQDYLDAKAAQEAENRQQSQAQPAMV